MQDRGLFQRAKADPLGQWKQVLFYRPRPYGDLLGRAHLFELGCKLWPARRRRVWLDVVGSRAKPEDQAADYGPLSPPSFAALVEQAEVLVCNLRAGVELPAGWGEPIREALEPVAASLERADDSAPRLRDLWQVLESLRRLRVRVDT